MVKNILKVILILCGIGFVCFVGWIVTIMYAFGGFDNDYSVTELKENFEAKKTEIYEVKKYVNQSISPNKLVHIEFDDNNTLGIFHVKVDDNFESNWNVKIKSGKADTLLRKLGWTTETLKTLKDKLDKANCIGVTSGEPCNISFQRSGMGLYEYIPIPLPCNISFQRSGMGMYSFNLFGKPIPDSLKTSYNDSCTYIMVNDRLVLEYGGGAIGSQCFPNFKRGGQLD